jgi:hypothetical protein
MASVIPGTVSANQTICTGTAPATLTSTAASGGTGSYTYLWEQSYDGITWLSAVGGSGNTTANYTPPTLTSTTRYRLATTSGTLNCGTVKSNVVIITVNPYATAANITAKDTTICYNTKPTLTASSTILLPAFKWYDSQISTAVLATTASYMPANNLTASRSYFVSVSGTGYCENVYGARKEVKVTVRPQSLYDYPDIRADVCSDISLLNLGKYLDTTAIIPPVSWTKVTGADIDANGNVTTSGLPNYQLHTYNYTISNKCVTGLVRKFYLQTIKDKTVRPLRDTIVVCYEKAEILQLNQIFGIDANGTWDYDAALDSHITEILVAPYTGALVFNGKAAYQDAGISYDTGYHVPLSKSIVFKYTPNSASCLAGKEYTVVIVLTPNIVL